MSASATRRANGSCACGSIRRPGTVTTSLTAPTSDAAWRTASDSGFRRVRTAAPATVALIAVAALAGCGSSGSNSTTATSTFRPLQPPATSTVPANTVPTAPRLDAAQRVPAGATTLAVTVERLVDPLESSHAALLPHTRAVGVIATIRNVGPAVYDSSSTGDFSVVASSGTATPVFAPAGICQTPLRDWDNQISPGEQRSGCVAFALGAKANVR